jgi:hypothetical protein
MSIFRLILAGDIFCINTLTLILKIIVNVKNIVTLRIKTITYDLKFSTYIITSLAEILLIMSVSNFKTDNILYVLPTYNN